MPYEIEFQVGHLERALKAVRQEIATPQQMLGSIGEALLPVNRERHKAGVAPDGTKWKELAPSTLAEGKRRGGILNKSGRMFESFNCQVQGDHLWLGFDGQFEAKKAEWHDGGTDPYTITPKKARALAFGGHVVKRVNHPGLPKRQLVGFPESDQQLAIDVVEDHLTLVLNRVR